MGHLRTWAEGAHLPRRTIRLRLACVYGTLFLVSGMALLGITYVFVSRTTDGSCFFKQTKGTSESACLVTVGAPAPKIISGSALGHGVPRTGQMEIRSRAQPSGSSGSSGSASGGTGLQQQVAQSVPGLTQKQFQAETAQLQSLANQQQQSDLHTLLVESGVALAIMAVLSVVLGWLVAGRVLRPLRTITAAAQRISATNLHERLSLKGPDDELKELGDTMDGLLARLDAAFASQRQFVANASHELRTPLARQRALAQVALADPDASLESLRQAHERVLASGVQQEKLIDALLTLSRAQSGAGPERQEPFDLADITRDLLVVKAAESAIRELHLDAVLAAAPVTGDPRLVERLVANLLDNAVRHNRAGGVVEVITGTRDVTAFISVANDGPEVRIEDIDRLYQPFQRAGTNRTVSGEGFGLGLSIVNAVTESQGASLSTRPRPQGGLTVEVTFPPRDAPPPTRPMSAAEANSEWDDEGNRQEAEPLVAKPVTP